MHFSTIIGNCQVRECKTLGKSQKVATQAPVQTSAPEAAPTQRPTEIPVEVPTFAPTAQPAPAATAVPLPAERMAAELGLTLEELAAELGVSVEELFMMSEEMLSALYMQVHADEYTAMALSYNDWDFRIDENGVLTAYYGSDTHVVVPDIVTAIGDKAFIFPKACRVLDRVPL